VPKSIIVTNPDKSEPVLLPTIEEIMEERIEVVGNEDLDFSPEERRRGSSAAFFIASLRTTS
jgi:hypothetical protein